MSCWVGGCSSSSGGAGSCSEGPSSASSPSSSSLSCRCLAHAFGNWTSSSIVFLFLAEFLWTSPSAFDFQSLTSSLASSQHFMTCFMKVRAWKSVLELPSLTHLLHWKWSGVALGETNSASRWPSFGASRSTISGCTNAMIDQGYKLWALEDKGIVVSFNNEKNKIIYINIYIYIYTSTHIYV